MYIYLYVLCMCVLCNGLFQSQSCVEMVAMVSSGPLLTLKEDV